MKKLLFVIVGLVLACFLQVVPCYATDDVLSARICIHMSVVNSADGVEVYLEGTDSARSVSLYRKTENEWAHYCDLVDDKTHVLLDSEPSCEKVQYVVVADFDGQETLRSDVVTNLYVPELEPFFPFATEEDGIVLRWGAVDGADAYFVYRYDNGEDSMPILVGETVETEFVDAESRLEDYRYFYSVRAVVKRDDRIFYSSCRPFRAFYDPIRKDTEEIATDNGISPTRRNACDSEANETTLRAVNWVLAAISDSEAKKVLGPAGWRGKNYSCSSLVSRGFISAGVPLLENSNGKFFYTDALPNVYLKSGFVEVTTDVDLITGEGLIVGDVLVNKKGTHTGMYLGSYEGNDNMLLDARKNHWVTKYNGSSYSWGRAFRYVGEP